MNIQISGHTDNVGKVSDNLTLSIKRAKSVTGYLSSKGINPKRISFKGYGSSRPIAVNNTEQGKATNRRTELSIISK
jgi:outer membrane protein OmpA-like peptidoglycan-associated protein